MQSSFIRWLEAVTSSALVLVFLFVFSQQSEEYFSFIEVVDSEDEDLQRALQESLTSSAATNIGYG